MLVLLCLRLAAAPLAHHVVVIGLDGCRPEMIRDHSTGALRMLWQEGACTLTAEAAVPSVTQVNFASILTSCLPPKHGIDQVAWTRGVVPKVKVTTIFETLAANRLSGAAFLGHEKLYTVETATAGIHFEHSPPGAKAAAPLAARYIRENRPAFTFVYFGDLDGVGHNSGWMSVEQIAAMTGINRGVALVVDAIRETSLHDDTIVIVTSDHGGHGKSHSQGTPEDRTIPWLCWGPGVKRGFVLPGPIYNYDTAATVLYILGVGAPPAWDGHAIKAAFQTPVASAR